MVNLAQRRQLRERQQQRGHGHVDRDSDDSSEDRRPKHSVRHGTRPGKHHRGGDDHEAEAQSYYIQNQAFTGERTYSARGAIGPDASSRRFRDNNADMSMFWWLIILPFFCIGVFTAIKAGLSAYRKKRHLIWQYLQPNECEPLRSKQLDGSGNHH